MARGPGATATATAATKGFSVFFSLEVSHWVQPSGGGGVGWISHECEYEGEESLGVTSGTAHYRGWLCFSPLFFPFSLNDI